MSAAEDRSTAGSSGHPERVAPEIEPSPEQQKEQPWGEGEDRPDHEGNEVYEQHDAPSAGDGEPPSPG